MDSNTASLDSPGLVNSDMEVEIPEKGPPNFIKPPVPNGKSEESYDADTQQDVFFDANTQYPSIESGEFPLGNSDMFNDEDAMDLDTLVDGDPIWIENPHSDLDEILGFGSENAKTSSDQVSASDPVVDGDAKDTASTEPKSKVEGNLEVENANPVTPPSSSSDRVSDQVESAKGEERPDLLHKSVTEGKRAESKTTPSVVLDERDKFYSGELKDSSHNKSMRAMAPRCLLRKGSNIIKKAASTAIRSKLPDMPLLPRVSRTTVQMFFAFLYLLTQRDWVETHTEYMANKMGFWEQVHPRLRFPSSVRHLTTKKAFLKRLEQEMIHVAWSDWEKKNRNKVKKEAWEVPNIYDDYDEEYPNFNDVTVPFIVWHKREDHELLALTDLVLRKTEEDENHDAHRIKKEIGPSRLSSRSRELLRLVTEPDDLFDKIKHLQRRVNEEVQKMEAKLPEDFFSKMDEENFVDHYTYYLPKTKEDIALLEQAEKQANGVMNADGTEGDNAEGEEEGEDGESPSVRILNRGKLVSKGSLSCKNYPMPPSTTMIGQANKAAKQAKKNIKPVVPPRAALKANTKRRQSSYVRHSRASKQKATEKMAKSLTEYDDLAEQDINMGDYEDGVNVQDFAEQGSFVEHNYQEGDAEEDQTSEHTVEEDHLEGKYTATTMNLQEAQESHTIVDGEEDRPMSLDHQEQSTEDLLSAQTSIENTFMQQDHQEQDISNTQPPIEGEKAHSHQSSLLSDVNDPSTRIQSRAHQQQKIPTTQQDNFIILVPNAPINSAPILNTFQTPNTTQGPTQETPIPASKKRLVIKFVHKPNHSTLPPPPPTLPTTVKKSANVKKGTAKTKKRKRTEEEIDGDFDYDLQNFVVRDDEDDDDWAPSGRGGGGKKKTGKGQKAKVKAKKRGRR